MNEICQQESGEYFMIVGIKFSIEEHNLTENLKKVEDILAKNEFGLKKTFSPIKSIKNYLN